VPKPLPCFYAYKNGQAGTQTGCIACYNRGQQTRKVGGSWAELPGDAHVSEKHPSHLAYAGRIKARGWRWPGCKLPDRNEIDRHEPDLFAPRGDVGPANLLDGLIAARQVAKILRDFPAPPRRAIAGAALELLEAEEVEP